MSCGGHDAALLPSNGKHDLTTNRTRCPEWWRVLLAKPYIAGTLTPGKSVHFKIALDPVPLPASTASGHLLTVWKAALGVADQILKRPPRGLEKT